MDEHNAIAQLKQGDIGGLETLVKRYQVAALRAAYLVTRDEALAEDIVQAAYVRVYERIAQFDSSRTFGPWFIRSVVNDALRVVTNRQRQTTLPTDAELNIALPSNVPDPHTLAEAAESNAAIEAALDQLVPEQRAAVVMRYFVGLSEREIAARLDCPPGTVKSRLTAARRHLRHLLHSLAPAKPNNEQYPPEGSDQL